MNKIIPLTLMLLLTLGGSAFASTKTGTTEASKQFLDENGNVINTEVSTTSYTTNEEGTTEVTLTQTQWDELMQKLDNIANNVNSGTQQGTQSDSTLNEKLDKLVENSENLSSLLGFLTLIAFPIILISLIFINFIKPFIR